MPIFPDRSRPTDFGLAVFVHADRTECPEPAAPRSCCGSAGPAVRARPAERCERTKDGARSRESTQQAATGESAERYRPIAQTSDRIKTVRGQDHRADALTRCHQEGGGD